MLFDDLELDPLLLQALRDADYKKATAIQETAIPVILSGRDLIAVAQTGTGKTAAFVLPLLQRLLHNCYTDDRVGALILTPTRELAIQVGESVKQLSCHTKLTSTVIYGGVGINPQIKALKKGVDIIIATPGRLLDLLDKKTVRLSMLDYFVLDEADRMLDMGFVKDIKKLRKQISNKRQNLFFSATFSKEVKALAQEFLDQPELIELSGKTGSADTVKQIIHPVDCNRKSHLLIKLILENDWHQVLVFVRTKQAANQLVKKLRRSDITTEAIHGNKGQATRLQFLEDFKAKKIRVLVATDLASRGLDIDQLPLVVNYELPTHAEDYVHRIGRSGRAGHEGQAISLVCVDEKPYLKRIEKWIKQKIELIEIKGFKPDPNKEIKPIDLSKESQSKSKGKQSRWRGSHRSHSNKGTKS